MKVVETNAQDDINVMIKKLKKQGRTRDGTHFKRARLHRKFSALLQHCKLWFKIKFGKARKDDVVAYVIGTKSGREKLAQAMIFPIRDNPELEIKKETQNI